MGIVYTANDVNDLSVSSLGRVTQHSTDGFDSQFVSSAIRFETDQSDPLDSLRMPFSRVAVGKVYLHCDVRVSNFIGDNRLDGHWFSFYDQNDNLIARLDHQDGLVRGQVFNNAGVPVNSSSISLANRAFYTWDISIEADGTDITMQWLIGGVSQFTITTGNTNATSCQRVDADIYRVGFTAAFDGFIDLSQIIITDNNESTLGWKLAGNLVSDTVGNYSQWTGSLANLSDDDLATVLSADVNNHRHSWNLEAYTGLTTGYSIRGVSLNCRSSKTPNSSPTLEQFIREGGVDYESGTPKDPLVTGSTQHFFDNNPADSLPFDFADLPLEVGIKYVI